MFTDFSGNHPGTLEVQAQSFQDSTTQLRALQGLEKLGWSQSGLARKGPHGSVVLHGNLFVCFFFACLMSILFLTQDHIDIPVNNVFSRFETALKQDLLIVLHFKFMVVV